MALLYFNLMLSHLMEQVTQVHHTSEDTIATEIMIEISDVLKDELGLLKGIQANVQLMNQHLLVFTSPNPSHLLLRERLSSN